MSAGFWIGASDLDISLPTLSNVSPIKLDYKVNFIASYEAGQTISFRVLRAKNKDDFASYDNCGNDDVYDDRKVFYN